jgi:hypothetical protein
MAWHVLDHSSTTSPAHEYPSNSLLNMHLNPYLHHDRIKVYYMSLAPKHRLPACMFLQTSRNPRKKAQGKVRGYLLHKKLLNIIRRSDF